MRHVLFELIAVAPALATSLVFAAGIAVGAGLVVGFFQMVVAAF